MVIDNVELNMYDISQRDEILLLMLRKGTITRKDAASIYCFELSSRILELENHNWTINKEKLYVKRKNRRHGTTITRYSIDREQVKDAKEYLIRKYRKDAC